MDFADPDAGVAQDGKCGARFFKLDGEVAGVVIDAEMYAEARVAGMFVAELFEEPDGLAAVLNQAEGFGFEPEMQLLPCAFGELRDVLDAFPERFADDLLLFTGADEFLEGAGQGADAALDSGGQELREQVEEEVGVIETLRRGPVGAVNIFLHTGAVEPAEGKSVDGEYVAGVFFEPALEFQKCYGVG